MSNNLENNINISERELESLKSRLHDAEEHRKGLLEHAHNLEKMLADKEDNIADFLKHLGNLENLLSQKDSDLTQHKTKLKELEARCYRYEQMLKEYRRCD